MLPSAFASATWRKGPENRPKPAKQCRSARKATLIDADSGQCHHLRRRSLHSAISDSGTFYHLRCFRLRSASRPPRRRSTIGGRQPRVQLIAQLEGEASALVLRAQGLGSNRDDLVEVE